MRTVLASDITGLTSLVAHSHTYLMIQPMPTAMTIGNPYLLIKFTMSMLCHHSHNHTKHKC